MMRSRHTSILTPLALALLTAALCIAAPSPALLSQSSPQHDEPHDFTTRLEALTPSNPLGYFELAEEVADVAATDTDRDLARQLFGLAVVLDPQRLGRSACLALADLETETQRRRRWLALADLLASRDTSLLPPTSAQHINPASRSGLLDTAAAMDVSRVFSLFRRGKGAAAAAVLKENPAALELLRSVSDRLPGGLDQFLADLQTYRNQRPNLTRTDLQVYLQLDAAFLAGRNRPWSTDLLLNTGSPLPEIDPDQLHIELGINPANTIYRHGAWRPAQ